MSEEPTWTPIGKSITLPPGFAVTPLRTLIEYDCAPMSFTFLSATEQLYYAHWIDEPSRYLAVPMSWERAHELEHGEIDLWTALQSDNAVVLDFHPDGETVMRAWQTKTCDIPSDCLPKPGVRLPWTSETRT